MRNHQLLGLLGVPIICLLLIPGALRAAETDGSVYQDMSSHYEAIRLALLGDSLEGVNEHASAIFKQATELTDGFSPAKAGVPESQAGDVEVALREIQSAASSLAAAGDLVSAREDLFALTKPMARYRKSSGTSGTVVAYCSMAQKAWIQPEGEIGNPYIGQKMPKCGEIVGE